MSYSADRHIGRSSGRRVEVIESRSNGEKIEIIAQGLPGEFFKFGIRSQGHGIDSRPPKGSIGEVMFANGRPDMPVFLGLEHPEQRPKDAKEGELRAYATAGQMMTFDENGHGTFEVPGTFTVKAAQIAFDGPITHTGNYNQSGVHVDDNGPHTAIGG